MARSRPVRRCLLTVAWGKQKGKSAHRIDTRNSRMVMLPHAVVDSPAYKHLTLRARCLLDGLNRRFNGWNNGDIGYSIRDMESDLRGPKTYVNHAVIGEAIDELFHHGFIDVGVTHRRMERLATGYRLTFASYGPPTNPLPASNDYLSWQPPAPKENFPVDATSAETGKLADTASAEWKHSADVTSAEVTETSHVSTSLSADPTSAHIITIPDPVLRRETGNKVNGKQHGLVGDSFMSADELRDWVRAHLETASVGAQSRLADAANVHKGTLSKFVRGRGLPREQCKAVQQALPRLEAAERKRATGIGN